MFNVHFVLIFSNLSMNYFFWSKILSFLCYLSIYLNVGCPISFVASRIWHISLHNQMIKLWLFFKKMPVELFFIYLYCSLNGNIFKALNESNGIFHLWESSLFLVHFSHSHYVLPRFSSYSLTFEILTILGRMLNGAHLRWRFHWL